MLVCRKNILSSFRIVFCFTRVLHLVSCRYFSQAEVLVTTCSRTVSRLLKILVRFLLNRSTMGKKNRFWPNHPYVCPTLHISWYEVCYWLLFQSRIQLFRKRLTEKVHATISKGSVSGFEITVLKRNFKRMAREAMDVCLRVLKRSSKSRFDCYSVRSFVSQTTSRDCHVHFFFDNLSRNSCI